MKKGTEEESEVEREAIGLMALATYLPRTVQDVTYIAGQSGIAVGVVREKLGIWAKHRAGPEDQTSAMAHWAGPTIWCCCRARPTTSTRR